MAIMYNPNLLSESADPQDSVRYGNVKIILEEIECEFELVTFYDNIIEDYTFIIKDKSPQYKGYKCRIFKGDVIKESDGTYSWFQNFR